MSEPENHQGNNLEKDILGRLSEFARDPEEIASVAHVADHLAGAELLVPIPASDLRNAVEYMEIAAPSMVAVATVQTKAALEAIREASENAQARFADAKESLQENIEGAKEKLQAVFADAMQRFPLKSSGELDRLAAEPPSETQRHDNELFQEIEQADRAKFQMLDTQSPPPVEASQKPEKFPGVPERPQSVDQGTPDRPAPEASPPARPVPEQDQPER